MASFIIAFGITNKIERGYSNKTSDRGGETINGISRNNFPRWSGWIFVDRLKQSANFEQLVNTDNDIASATFIFFKAQFWDALKLDKVNSQAIANELYDTAVNCGTGTAAGFLQRALNVSNLMGKYGSGIAVDNNVGTQTITALNAHPKPETVYKILNVLQGERYIHIAESAPDQEININGWFTRVFESTYK